MALNFNLIDENWIPCSFLDGSFRYLNLKDLFKNASEIHEIVDPSPLVKASIQRFLLAILHRNFGPKTYDDWITMWNSGKFDFGKLDKYQNNWHGRFNLFDVDRPFYQQPQSFILKEATSVSKIAIELAAGNNYTLFDHSQDKSPKSISYAEAARLLVTYQSYAIGFGRSATGQLTDARFTRGVTVFLCGNNLFETLMLNLIRYDGGRFPSSFISTGDAPNWERAECDEPGTERRLNGYLDFLTWQSRAIHLIPNEQNSISHIYLSQGTKALKQNESVYNPFQVYKKDAENPYQPIHFIDTSKAIWKNSPSLLMLKDESYKPVSSFEQIAYMVWNKIVPIHNRYNIEIIGLATQQGQAAKIEFWYKSRIPLPLSYLNNKDLVKDISRAVDAVDKFSRILYETTKIMAKMVLYPEKTENDILRPRENDAVMLFVKSLDISKNYWASLEVPYYGLVRSLADSSEAEERKAKVDFWIRDVVSRNAKAAFNEGASKLPTDGRHLRSMTRALNNFNIKGVKYLRDEGVLV